PAPTACPAPARSIRRDHTPRPAPPQRRPRVRAPPRAWGESRRHAPPRVMRRSHTAPVAGPEDLLTALVSGLVHSFTAQPSVQYRRNKWFYFLYDGGYLAGLVALDVYL